MFIKDMDKLLNEVKEQYDFLDNLVEELRKENLRLKDEAYKDKGLSKIQEQLNREREDFRRGFPITKEEEGSINAWVALHLREKHWDKRNNCPLSTGAVGGRFTYEFLPTSIGVFGTIKCHCGDKFCFRKDL